MLACDQRAGETQHVGPAGDVGADDPFKIRAYRNGADIAANHPHHFASLDEAGLREIPGIGKDLAARIREIAETGGSAFHRELPPAQARLAGMDRRLGDEGGGSGRRVAARGQPHNRSEPLAFRSGRTRFGERGGERFAPRVIGVREYGRSRAGLASMRRCCRRLGPQQEPALGETGVQNDHRVRGW